MKKYFSPDQLELITILVIVVLFNTLTLRFLFSIHFNVCTYIDYIYKERVEFKQHKNDFDYLAEQIYFFVDDHPNFFDEFDGEFTVTDDGIKFYKKGYDYPENVYLHVVAEEDWVKVQENYYKAFPDVIWNWEVNCKVFPNYISFYTVLVYTRDNRYPKEMVEG